MLQPFTVVGVYEDNGEAFADWYMTTTAAEAAAAAVQEHPDVMKVLCVFEGHLSDQLLQPQETAGV